MPASAPDWRSLDHIRARGRLQPTIGSDRSSMTLTRRKILITGGAGFVGSSLALNYKRDHPDTEVIALDNLKRHGSELALPRLREGGVAFVHGDVRTRDDLDATGAVDLLIECSAE